MESSVFYQFRTHCPFAYENYLETIREDDYELLYRGKDCGVYSFNDLIKGVRRMPDDWREVDEEFVKKEFGHRLRCRMWLRGVMQDELAEAIGVSQSCISSYIRGTHMPNYYTIIRIAQVLRCSIDDFRYHF